MANPENGIFCQLDGSTPTARERRRLAALQKFDLLSTETVAIFDEATQTVARLLDAPICILGFMLPEQLKIKSAVGLSKVGLMNPVAQSRQLSRDDCFCVYVVDSHQVLAIQDTTANPLLARSLLVQHYGIRAYLGAPLMTAEGQCLGALAIMESEPRNFTDKDREFIAITARWCMSEFERSYLLQEQISTSLKFSKPSTTENTQEEQFTNLTSSDWDEVKDIPAYLTSTIFLKVKLLAQLTQELRTPLTSVMGMASVLTRQVYGPLTSKQKEYLEIIHRSGQDLVSLVDEIVALSVLDETSEQLHLCAVDIDMLCQQAIDCLFKLAHQRQQQVRLSVEPGRRIWLLDKDKVRQIVYYLVFSVIHSAQTGSEIRVHVSRKADKLMIAVWGSHPWLVESSSQTYGEIAQSSSPSTAANTTGSNVLDTSLGVDKLKSRKFTTSEWQSLGSPLHSRPATGGAFVLIQEQRQQKLWNHASREGLGLLLSCHLAELHQGEIFVEGSLESGYRYVVNLPLLEPDQERV